MNDRIAFILFGSIALIGGINVVLRRHPVHAALWLVGALLGVAGVFLTVGAGFLGAIQVLVYAGAIMVLFLFVIMLLNLDELPRLKDVDWKKVVAFSLGMIVLSQLVFVVALATGALPEGSSSATAAELGSAASLGTELFSKYAFHLEIIAILLLAATIGAVLLAKKRFV